MAAHHTLKALTAGFIGNSNLKIADKIHCLFDFLLQVSRQRPIGQAHSGADFIEVAV